MRIGIVGAGHIGKTLARKLSAAGHEVKIANSRGPETISSDILSTKVRAVTVDKALTEVDAVILSVPFARNADLAPLLSGLAPDIVIMDTSNYYPFRDGKMEAIDAGKAEGVWVAEILDRPITKAWNSIGAESLANKGQAAGVPDRIALPVAGDRASDRAVAMALVEETGFDAVDAGALAESWRQQPGAPCYCTNLTRGELVEALSTADASRSPKRRDLAMAVVMERIGGTPTAPDAEYTTRLNRAIFR